MKGIPIVALSTIIACLTLSAQETQPARGGGLAERFRQLDRDGDGKLSGLVHKSANVFWGSRRLDRRRVWSAAEFLQ
jgi:hypothetical protein